MRQFYISTLILILAILHSVQTYKQIYYLYETLSQQDILTVQKLKQNRRQYPVNKIDCKKQNCDKFKIAQYPALIIWNGPGTSYKTLNPANQEGLQLYLKSQQQHPLKALRDFVEKISLIQAFIGAIAVATLLYFVFSFLFQDKTGLEEAKLKKNL